MHSGRNRQSRLVRAARASLLGLLLLGLATLAGALFDALGLPETNIVIVYLLSVVLTARYTQGVGYGVACSLLATCAFNFFFTAPYFTLQVYEMSYLATFAVMTATALITSALTGRVKRSAQQAQRRQAQTQTLYNVLREFTGARSVAQLVDACERSVRALLGCEVRLVLEGEQPEGRAFPLSGRNGRLSVLSIPEEQAASLGEERRQLLESIVESAALALDRLQFERRQIELGEQAERERYRANLLRAIFHDLRTPLSAIMGKRLSCGGVMSISISAGGFGWRRRAINWGP